MLGSLSAHPLAAHHHPTPAAAALGNLAAWESVQELYQQTKTYMCCTLKSNVHDMWVAWTVTGVLGFVLALMASARLVYMARQRRKVRLTRCCVCNKAGCCLLLLCAAARVAKEASACAGLTGQLAAAQGSTLAAMHVHVPPIPPAARPVPPLPPSPAPNRRHRRS